MMVAVICNSCLRGDLLVGGLDEDRRLRPGTPFTLEYTIPHNTAFKDIELVSESDWEMFVEKMQDTVKGGWEAHKQGKGQSVYILFFDKTDQL